MGFSDKLLDRIGTIPLPEKVFAGGMQRLIQQRLHSVPAAYSPLLQLAAVAGRNLDRDLLQSLAPDLDLEAWLTTCANAAVLEVQENRWRFAHDKLREGLLDALLPHERQALHQQIGQAIERVYPEAPEQAAALVP